VTVTANTIIAKGCIIGANAVVTHDTEPNGLYAGVPARRLRDRVRADIQKTP
jgi:acetyltransferase-like isoleucine patch superfamily enzyme